MSELRRVVVRGPIDLAVQLRPGSAVDSDILVDRLPNATGGSVDRFEVVVDGWRFEIAVEPARHAELRERAASAAAEHSHHGETTVRAQIPGRVTRLWVGAGDEVEAGQRLLAVEAMKMENEVRAPRAGRVGAIHVAVGGRVERDDDLVTLG